MSPPQKIGGRVWPWKNGTRLLFIKTNEEVTLRRVEPATLGITYQLTHRSFDVHQGKWYRWKSRAWAETTIRGWIKSGKARILK